MSNLPKRVARRDETGGEINLVDERSDGAKRTDDFILQDGETLVGSSGWVVNVNTGASRRCDGGDGDGDGDGNENEREDNAMSDHNDDDERLDAERAKTDKARQDMLDRNRRAGRREDEPTPPTEDQIPRRR